MAHRVSWGAKRMPEVNEAVWLASADCWVRVQSVLWAEDGMICEVTPLPPSMMDEVSPHTLAEYEEWWLE